MSYTPPFFACQKHDQIDECLKGLEVNALTAQSQCFKSSNSLTLIFKINEFEVSFVGGR